MNNKKLIMSTSNLSCNISVCWIVLMTEGHFVKMKTKCKQMNETLATTELPFLTTTVSKLGFLTLCNQSNTNVIYRSHCWANFQKSCSQEISPTFPEDDDLCNNYLVHTYKGNVWHWLYRFVEEYQHLINLSANI